MKKLTKLLLGLAIGVACHTAQADSTLHNASDWRLLKAACPESWRSMDKALPSAGDDPVPPTSISWSNSTDSDDFAIFLRNFIIATTKNNQTFDTKLADPLLVASECAKRRNIAVNAYMNKDVGIIPLLKKLINMVPILMSLGLFDADEL